TARPCRCPTARSAPTGSARAAPRTPPCGPSPTRRTRRPAGWTRSPWPRTRVIGGAWSLRRGWARAGAGGGGSRGRPGGSRRRRRRTGRSGSTERQLGRVHVQPERQIEGALQAVPGRLGARGQFPVGRPVGLLPVDELEHRVVGPGQQVLGLFLE